MKNNFSKELKKAIEDSKVVINQNEKLALILFDAGLSFQITNDIGNLLFQLRWQLGIKAELENHGYVVKSGMV